MALSMSFSTIEDLMELSSIKEEALSVIAHKVGYEKIAEYRALAAQERQEGPRRLLVDGDGTAFTVMPFEIEGRGGWSIVSCEPATTTLRIPESFEGRPVLAIGAGAFQNLTTLRSITMPDTVIAVGPSAFVGDESLRKLVLSRTLDRFDAFWLRGCDALTHLVLPGKLRRLRQGLLENCPLKTLEIGPELAEIDLGFFKNSVLTKIVIDPANPHLKSDGELIYGKDGRRLIAAAVPRARVEVDAGCEIIGRKAFFFDDALEEVHLPATITTIEGYAFSHTSLREFNAPPALEALGVKAFFRAQRLTSVTLDDRLRSIGDEAFAQTALERLIIPSSVEELGKRIVANTSVVVAGQGATLSVKGNPVYELGGDGTLYRRDRGTLTLIEMLDGDRAEVALDDRTTAIGYRAFVRHRALEKITLPDGVRFIGESAFRGCARLREINLPKSLERIEAEAFLDTRVDALEIPASLEFIGRIALITRGGNRALRPPSLTSVTVSPNNKRFFMESGILCERADRGARALVYVGPERDVTIGRSVIDIEDYAFAGVVGLSALRIHRFIRHLGASALTLGGPVPLIEIELDDEAAAKAGRRWLSVDVPLTFGGGRALTLATADGRINAPLLRRLVDNVIITEGDVGERARYALPRLADPVFLDPAYEERFRKFLTRCLATIVCRFARTGYYKGFEALRDLGFLNASTIIDAIDAVNDDGDVEATSYLLEMKRRSFGDATLDFKL